jgi:hypothetical protein
MPCRSSQRLTGQLVAKPRIIPICIKNQWLELSIGGGDSQIAYSATAIHCGSAACLALAYRDSERDETHDSTSSTQAA